MEPGGGSKLDELKPTQTLPKGGLRCAQDLITEKFLFVWNRIKVEVQDMQVGFALKYRPSPLVERE
jgi:hypothetical protein